MSDDILKERAARVEDAFRLLQGNKDSLGNIPGIMRQLITLRVWEGYDWRGKTISFSTFREFVETPPPEGLGTTIDDLVQLCKKYPEVADQIDQIMQEQMPAYHPPIRGNITTPYKKAKGNSFRQSIRRLRVLAQNDPKADELRQRVLRGEISANKALLELGKRRQRFSIEPTPTNVITFIKRYMSTEQIEILVEKLQEGK
jgi:hypothetical protein